MPVSRPVRSALLPVALVVGFLFPAPGCGGGGNNQTIQVDPQFQKNTNSMLEQMSKTQMEKFKKQGAAKR